MVYLGFAIQLMALNTADEADRFFVLFCAVLKQEKQKLYTSHNFHPLYPPSLFSLHFFKKSSPRNNVVMTLQLPLSLA